MLIFNLEKKQGISQNPELFDHTAGANVFDCISRMNQIHTATTEFDH